MQTTSETPKESFLIRAPLATFDTIDLGDDLPKKTVYPTPTCKSNNRDCMNETHCSNNDKENSSLAVVREEENACKLEIIQNPLHSSPKGSPKIDKKIGNVKKDSAKGAKCKGSPKKESKNEKSKAISKKELAKNEKKLAKEKKGQKDLKINTKSESQLPPDAEGSTYFSYDNEKDTDNYVYIRHEPLNADGNVSHTHLQDNSHILCSNLDSNIETVYIPAPSLTSNIPVKICSEYFSSDDSDSEISQSTGNQTHKNESIRNRRHRLEHNAQRSPQSPLTLSPDLVDPHSIKSPSKRKAYEKRLQRQQVKTSPIARPRSTTPISVVTLDEYTSVLSSPDEGSPLSPTFHKGEKLKVTLPPDEFSFKFKSSKKLQNVSDDSDEQDSVLEFNEELLFSHTRSALVVDESGNLPVSPRRVLIPPTISPSSSPKLSTRNVEENIEGSGVGPRLLYYHEPSQVSDEKWAVFPDDNKPAGISDEVNQTAENVLELPSYAKDITETGQEEDILIVNITKDNDEQKCDIDIVLSSSSSSASHPSPSPSITDNMKNNTESPSETETMLKDDLNAGDGTHVQ